MEECKALVSGLTLLAIARDFPTVEEVQVEPHVEPGLTLDRA